ncbi:hypothetical protein Q5P01_010899 [Channa striata]|uniref:Uncharacterized protein n=1 Tax=Channa striata TaxID=64152 RepID=A0AA88SMC2_CHASR|nr:hypothetical protein Q5P01_010899 [Channa striata]
MAWSLWTSVVAVSHSQPTVELRDQVVKPTPLHKFVVFVLDKQTLNVHSSSGLSALTLDQLPRPAPLRLSALQLPGRRGEKPTRDQCRLSEVKPVGGKPNQV